MNVEQNIGKQKSPLFYINIIVVVMFTITTILVIAGCFISNTDKKSKLIFINGDDDHLDSGTFASNKVSSGLSLGDIGSPCVTPRQKVEGLVNLPLSYRIQECDSSKNLSCVGGIVKGGGICLKEPGGTCETSTDCVPIYNVSADNIKSILCVDNICSFQGEILNKLCSDDTDCKTNGPFSQGSVDTNHRCFKNKDEPHGRCKVDIFPRDSGCYFDSDCYKYTGNDFKCSFEEKSRTPLVEIVSITQEKIVIEGDSDKLLIFFTNLEENNNIYLLYQNVTVSKKVKKIDSENNTIYLVEDLNLNPGTLNSKTDIYLSDPSNENGVCLSNTPSMFPEESIGGISFPCKGKGKIKEGICHDNKSMVCDIEDDNLNLITSSYTSDKKCLVGEGVTQYLYKNKVFEIFPSLYNKLKTTGFLQNPNGKEGDVCTITGDNGCEWPYQCITIDGITLCRLPFDRQTCIGYKDWDINYCNEGFECITDDSTDLTYFYNPNTCVEKWNNPVDKKFFVFSVGENKYLDFFSPTLSGGENLISYRLNSNVVSKHPEKSYLPPTLSSPSMVAFLTNKSLKITDSETNYTIKLNKKSGVEVNDVLFDQDDNLLIFYSKEISTVRIRKIPFRRDIIDKGEYETLPVRACFNHGLKLGASIFYVHENPVGSGGKDFTYISPDVKYEVCDYDNPEGILDIKRSDGKNITVLDDSPSNRYFGEFFYSYDNNYILESSLIKDSVNIYGPLVAPSGFFRSGDKLTILDGNFLVKTIQMAENQTISVTDNIVVKDDVFFNVYTDKYDKLEKTINLNTRYFPNNKNIIYQGILLNSFYDTSVGSVPVLGTAPGTVPIIKTPLQFTSNTAVVTLNKGCINYGLIILKKEEYSQNLELEIGKQEEYYFSNGMFIPNGMNNSVTYAFDDTEKISFSVCKENNKSYFLVNKEMRTFEDGNINLLQKVRYSRDEEFDGSVMEYKNTVGGNIFFTYENTTVSPTPSKIYFDSDTREDNKVDGSRIYDFSNNITGTDFTFINTYINDNNTKNPFFANKTPPVGIISHMGKMNYTDNDESDPDNDPVQIGFKETSYLEDKCKPIPLRGKVIVGVDFSENDNTFHSNIFIFKNQEDIDVILNNPSSEIVISVRGEVSLDTTFMRDLNSNAATVNLKIQRPATYPYKRFYGVTTDNIFYRNPSGDPVKVSQNFIITSIEDYHVTVTRDVLTVKVNVSLNSLFDPNINTNYRDIQAKKYLLENGDWNLYIYNIYPLDHIRITSIPGYSDNKATPVETIITDLYNIYDASGLYTSTKNDEFFKKKEMFKKTSFNKILCNSTDTNNKFSIYSLSDGYGQSYTLSGEDPEKTEPQFTGPVSAMDSYETSQIISWRGTGYNEKYASYSISDNSAIGKWMAFIADNFPYSALEDEKNIITTKLKGGIYGGTGPDDEKYWTFSFNGTPSELSSLKTGGVSQKILPYFFNLNWVTLLFTKNDDDPITYHSKYNGPKSMNYLWGRSFIETQTENEPYIEKDVWVGGYGTRPPLDTLIIKAGLRPTFSGIIRIPGISSFEVPTKMYAVNNLFLSTLQKYPSLQNVYYNNKPLSDLKEDYVISTKVEKGKFKTKGALNLGVDTNSFYLDKTTNINLTNQILFSWPDLTKITTNPTFKNNPVISKIFFETRFGNFDNSISYYALVNYPIVTRTGTGELFLENIDENNRRNYLLRIVDDILDTNNQNVTGIPIKKDIYEGNNLDNLKKMQVDEFTGNIYGTFKFQV